MGLRVFLGHGASGTAASMAPFVEGLRARGIDATAIDLPKRKAEEAVDVLLRLAPPSRDVVVGGHSYGGRVASLAAAEHGYAGLVCFSYPLHRPGYPEGTDDRIAHWPRIACPALVLNGERDPLSPIAEIRRLVPLLPNGRLVSFPGAGHGLRDSLEAKLDAAAEFLLNL